MEKPIEVSASPIPAQVMAALRTILIALGSYLTGRGILTEGDIATLGVVLPALATVATFVWSQWATNRNAKKLAVVAEAAPNTVAVTK